jgi:type I restriction enzyme S subunit
MMAMRRSQTQTRGGAETTGYIPGLYSLAVGMPSTAAPDGWTWTKLSEVARLETGHTPSRRHPEYWDGDIPWIGIRDATANHGRTITDTNQHTNALGIENSSARVLPKNTVCLSRTASVGYVIVMGRPMATSQDFVNWVCSDRIDHHFLKYILLSENRSFASFASGTTHQTIYFPEVRGFHVCLPSIAMQRKIALILSAYDDLIENNTRRIAILEEMAQAIYREWFVNFHVPGHEDIKLVDSPLGKIPDVWQLKCLSELGFIGRGKSRHRPRNAPELYGGPYPLFQTGDIKAANTFLWKHSQSYSEAGLAQSKLWEPGTLCITIAANIAETAILSKTACFPDSVVGFVSNSDRQCVYFVKLYLETVKRQMQNLSRGTTQDNLSLEKLLSFKVPTPPPSILSSFHAIVTPLFDNLLCLAKKNENLRLTRELLLPKLISGQLNVHQLEDDFSTTAELLEEVQA